MPWKAEIDGEMVNLYTALADKKDLSGWARSGYKCVGCGSDMRLVAVGSPHVSPHFRHHSDAACGVNKSREHSQAQDDLYQYLTEAMPECEVDIEHYIAPEVDGAKTFVDVAVLKNGERFEAHEVQVSRQSIDEFNRRTQRYYALGFDVVCWWVPTMGRNDSREFKNWAIEACGCYGTFDIKSSSRILETRSEGHGSSVKQRAG